MSLTLNIARRVALLTTVGSVAALAAACSVSTPSAPSVSGPSEFGTSITLSATPEILVQDGVSQAVITAVARDAASKPIKGLTIRWDATATTTRVLPVSLSTTASVTDAEGRAAILLTAPETPTQAPFAPDFIIVNASPMSGSTDDVAARTIRIELKAPPGVLTANTPPVARFTVEPKVGIINHRVTFNAATTTDEGEPCLARCTYTWDFGDGTSATGITTSHEYASANALGFTVTLTVRDDRGGIGSTSIAVPVSATAVVAQFSVVPASPQVGVEAMFDASATQVGTGVGIQNYSWNFGDGVIEDTTTPTKGHVYLESRTYTVTLTVTATSGQTSTIAKTVIVP